MLSIDILPPTRHGTLKIKGKNFVREKKFFSNVFVHKKGSPPNPGVDPQGKPGENGQGLLDPGSCLWYRKKNGNFIS